MTKRNLVSSGIFVLCLCAVYLSFSKSYSLASIPNYFLLASIAILIHIVFIASHKKTIFPGFLVTLLFFWSLLSGIWAFDFQTYLSGITRTTTFFLCVGASVAIFLSYKNLHEYILENLLCALFIVFGVYFYWCMNQRVMNGFCHPFGNPNLASSVLSFALLVNLGFLLKYYRKNSVLFFCGVISLCFFGGFLITLSSEATIVSLMCAIAITIFCLSSHKKWLLLLASLAVIALYPLRFFILNKLWPSIEIRGYLWRDTWAMCCDSFHSLVCGWGAGHFFFVFPQFRMTDSFSATYATNFIDYPHGFLLETCSELGVIGAVIFTAIFASIFVSCLKEYKSKNNVCSLVFATAVCFFFIHGQVSVVFSYPNIQFLMAIMIGWYLSRSSQLTFLPTPHVVSICVSGVFLIFWKFCLWDMLLFHRDFQTAIHNSFRNSQVGMEQMAAITPPYYEDFHTLRWRHRLGSLLVDNYENSPRLVEENMETYDVLNSRVPGYGNYFLHKAIFYAKQKNRELTDEYFTKFSQKNPFDSNLWVYWGLAVKRNDATQEIYMQNVKKAFRAYPQHGTILMAKAISFFLYNDVKQGIKYLQKAQKWSRGVGNRRANVRKWCAQIEKDFVK